ncbi:MAG TPA: hypothetical protein VGN95_10955 [Pyrinomonadaceae bacterium]|jgi:hypothetical protein|nr:hypothetical protein [Pyrinomonadaceae bacterium]
MNTKRMTSLKKHILLIATSVLMLALTACGAAPGTAGNVGGTTANPDSKIGTTTRSAKATKIDPCTLVTKEEATALLGVDVTVKSENHDPDLECTYESASGPQTYLKIEAMIRDGAQWLSNIKRGTEQRQGKIEPLSGIGDQSFINIEPNSPNNLELTVLKGDVLFGLKTLNVADAGEKLKPLAQTAVSRLP